MALIETTDFGDGRSDALLESQFRGFKECQEIEIPSSPDM